MYNLRIEPAEVPVTFGKAVSELYEHARNRNLVVKRCFSEDGETITHYELINPRTNTVVGRATISLVLAAVAA